MNKYLLTGLFLLHAAAILAQEKVITGKVTDSTGEALIGVAIYQVNSFDGTHTDHDGLFHLLIDEQYPSQLEIRLFGYHPVFISNADTISDLLRVKMIADTSVYNHFYKNSQESYSKQRLKFGFILFLQADFIFNDFEDFRSVLKDYNVDLMNKSRGIFSVEMAGTYKSYYAGLNIGWASIGNYRHDSLDIEFNTAQYGLHFGYNLLNSKRILFTPKVAVKWNRYRLLNNDKESRIPIEQYVSERDIDLRFNQITGFIGFNLSYKIKNFNVLSTEYWTVGVYGGYAFKLNDNPWIYSRGNRLTSSRKISVENYNLGIHFSFNIDGE